MVDLLGILSLSVSIIVVIILAYIVHNMHKTAIPTGATDVGLLRNEVAGIKETVNQLNTSLGNLSQSIGEIKNASGNLATILTTAGEIKKSTSAINDLLTTTGQIKQSTDLVSNGMMDIQKFVTLMSGSNQKKGTTGETFIRSYLNTLPRELWESQFQIPGGGAGRVDYALRMTSEGKDVYLPIDAKFSLPKDTDDEKQYTDEANKLALKRSDEITQYIVPASTTDFAIMVLANPVYYSLKDDTVRELAEKRIVPTPVEGVIVLCNLALRAHQTITIQQSTIRLRDYSDRVLKQLVDLEESMKELEKKLRASQKYAKETLDNIDYTITELKGITTHLQSSDEKSAELPRT